MPIVTAKGEITPDGQLRIIDMPKLPAGPVSVVIRTLDNPKAGQAIGRDVVAGREVDDAAGEMSSYDNLPDRDEH